MIVGTVRRFIVLFSYLIYMSLYLRIQAFFALERRQLRSFRSVHRDIVVNFRLLVLSNTFGYPRYVSNLLFS